MMDQLEGTTVELIHRRRLRSFHLGYLMVGVVAALLGSLPFVRTDVVCSSAGMLRPRQEPMEILAPRSGMVAMGALEEGRVLKQGDTLLLYRLEREELRLNLLKEKRLKVSQSLNDIHCLLHGGEGIQSTIYRQKQRLYQEQIRALEIESAFLGEEFRVAETLYAQEVIPLLEFQKASTSYHAILTRREALKENFRSGLEEKMYVLQEELLECEGEILSLQASMRSLAVLAPVDGILYHCAGISGGSQVHAGLRLGTIVPEGPLVAECLVHSRDMAHVREGMLVKLRFEHSVHERGKWLQLRVEGMDPDALLLEGQPYYRVRCRSMAGNAAFENRLPGMSFSAKLVLYRCSIGDLLVSKIKNITYPEHGYKNRH